MCAIIYNIVLVTRDSERMQLRMSSLERGAVCHRRCLSVSPPPVGRVTRPRQFREHHRCVKTRRVGNNFIPLQPADPGKAASRWSEPVTHSVSRNWPSPSEHVFKVVRTCNPLSLKELAFSGRARSVQLLEEIKLKPSNYRCCLKMHGLNQNEAKSACAESTNL